MKSWDPVFTGNAHDICLGYVFENTDLLLKQHIPDDNGLLFYIDRFFAYEILWAPNNRL